MTITGDKRSTLVTALRKSLPANFDFTTSLMYKGFNDKEGRSIELDLIIDEALLEFTDEASYSVIFDEISEWIYDVGELEIDHFEVLTTDKAKEIVKCRKEIFHTMRENCSLIAEGLKEKGFACKTIKYDCETFTITCTHSDDVE